jgi:hypothetical protein
MGESFSPSQYLSQRREKDIGEIFSPASFLWDFN